MARIISLALLDESSSIVAPGKWSYSSAKAFAECPKKWQLKQVILARFKGPLPPLFNRGALEGTLLHELLKCFSQAPEGFRPRRKLKELVEEWRGQHRGSSRQDINLLCQRISLDKILNLFHQFYPRVVSLTAHAITSNDGERERKYGPEIYVKDPGSKLFGYIDYIDREGLTDFKTGKESEDHQEQVLLYGAIWKARWNETPKQVSVSYGDVPEILKFTPKVLDQVLEDWRGRVKGYDTQIGAGLIQANPSPEVCSRCPVRAMCPDYWRVVYPETIDSIDQRAFTDFMPSPEAIADKTPIGTYVRDKLSGKTVSLFIEDIPGLQGRSLSQFRALNLQMRWSEQHLQLVANAQTEFFSDCP